MKYLKNILITASIVGVVAYAAYSQTLNSTASLIGLTASQIPGVITNNQTGVALQGTFTNQNGYTGIVTNWFTGGGVNSNRVYYSSGVVTNVTFP
jgi:hypothetical protein